MKVAFIGTHGTGKTTLCHLLTGEMKRRGMHAAMVAEIARECPLPINKKSLPESQLWILMTQIAREIESSSAYDHVVCDRSVLDNYAYNVHSSGRDTLMEQVVDGWIGSYDVLFKVPDCYPLVGDGVRDTDLAFQSAIDRQVDALLIEKGIPSILLPEENQIDFVIGYLQLPPVKNGNGNGKH